MSVDLSKDGYEGIEVVAGEVDEKSISPNNLRIEIATLQQLLKNRLETDAEMSRAVKALAEILKKKTSGATRNIVATMIREHEAKFNGIQSKVYRTMEE